MGCNVKDIVAEMQEFQADIRAEEKSYMKYYLDVSMPIKEDDFLFEIGGVPTIPTGELIGLTGKAKKGKSQFGYYLIGAMLSGMAKGAVKPIRGDYKVCIFDTEQSQRNLLKCCQRALKLAEQPIETPNEHLMPFFMRSLPIEERKTEIEKAISGEQPTLVFLDGIRDLVFDFNNLEQSNEIIQWLLSLTANYGCTIICVLHQNKKEGDSTMRGHLGTELMNKLTDCFEVSKKDGKFMVSCTDSRNIPCGDVCFSLDAEGHFKEESVEAEDKNAAKVNEILRVLDLCFKNKQQMKYGELVESYQMEACVSERTAKSRIKEAKEHDAILVQNGFYTLRGKSV